MKDVSDGPNIDQKINSSMPLQGAVAKYLTSNLAFAKSPKKLLQKFSECVKSA